MVKYPHSNFTPVRHREVNLNRGMPWKEYIKMFDQKKWNEMFDIAKQTIDYKNLLDNPPQNIDDWVKIIEKKKNEILNTGKNFSLQKFQDIEGLIATTTVAQADIKTFKHLRDKAGLRIACGPCYFTYETRGVFFSPFQPLGLPGEPAAHREYELYGFTEKGQWLHLRVWIQTRSKNSSSFGSKESDYTLADLSIHHITIPKITEFLTSRFSGLTQLKSAFIIWQSLRQYLMIRIENIYQKTSVLENLLKQTAVEEAYLRKLFK